MKVSLRSFLPRSFFENALSRLNQLGHISAPADRSSNNTANVSRISGDAYIKGEVHFKDTMEFSGKIDGSFIAESGNLSLSPSSEVHGDIGCLSVLSQGKIHGNVSAGGQLTLQRSSELVGDIRTNILAIQEGAVIHGRCSMFEETSNFDYVAMPLEELRHHLGNVLQKKNFAVHLLSDKPVTTERRD